MMELLTTLLSKIPPDVLVSGGGTLAGVIVIAGYVGGRREGYKMGSAQAKQEFDKFFDSKLEEFCDKNTANMVMYSKRNQGFRDWKYLKSDAEMYVTTESYVKIHEKDYMIKPWKHYWIFTTMRKSNTLRDQWRSNLKHHEQAHPGFMDDINKIKMFLGNYPLPQQVMARALIQMTFEKHNLGKGSDEYVNQLKNIDPDLRRYLEKVLQ